MRCRRCGHACSSAAWRALPRDRTLTRADVTTYVSDWPAGIVVEVKACGECGVPIAWASAA